jgi:hypothetical protein
MSDFFYINNRNMIETSSVLVTRRQDGTPLQVNDVWMDTSENKLKQWNGSAWTDKKCLLILTMNTTPTVAANAKVPWNIKTVDTNNAFDIATSNFTVPTTGNYILIGELQTTAAAIAGGPETQVNGSVVGVGGKLINSTIGFSTLQLSLNQGQVVSFHQSSLGLNILAGFACSYSIYEL